LGFFILPRKAPAAKMDGALTLESKGNGMEMSAKSVEVFEKVLALRKLATTTGVNSARTQRNLLLSLSDDELATVARALEFEACRPILCGVKDGQ
jgi:hypothetical protein